MAKRRAAKAAEKMPPAPLAGADLEETPTELVDLAGLKNHPQNYKRHPDAQLAHVAETIRIAGIYKNIVVARDNTILMGHGVAEAARRAGRKQISARRLDLDPDDPRALKLVAADNEVGNLAERDDAALAGLLRGIVESEGLLGTGLGDEEWGRLIAVVDGGGAPGTTGHGSLADKFLVPPFSVLDARQGYWQDRKRAWLALGIQSELGRGGGANIGRLAASDGTGPELLPEASRRKRGGRKGDVKMAMHNDPMQRKTKYDAQA